MDNNLNNGSGIPNVSDIKFDDTPAESFANLYGGSTHFGYPDKTYFNRIKEELASKGVIQDNIDEDITKIADDLLNNQYD